MKKVSIIISNWNGKNLLKENLPSVVRAIKYSGGDYEVIVVDDASSDGSQEFIKKNYPQIKLIELKENKGFGEANNIAILQSKNDIIVLLNNDMSVKKNYFSFITSHFDDENIFAITPQINMKDTSRKKIKTLTSSWAEFRRGFWHDVDNVEVKDKEDCYLSLTAPGGGTAFNKEKFVSLGGFDSLYYPFYYEDTDLSYRAWKRGWKIIYEPRAVVYHRCSQTITTHFGKRPASLVKKRNYYLFIWKNITDRPLILQHLLFLPLFLLNKLVSGRVTWIKAFFLALKQLKEALVRRRIVKKESVFSDRSILNLFRQKKSYEK